MQNTTEDKLKLSAEAGQLLNDGVPDQELIALIRQGDVTALDIVFERYSAAVIRKVAGKIESMNVMM